MGYFVSFIMFMWALLSCHNGGQDILAAGLFIGSAVFYLGAHLGALVEIKEVENKERVTKQLVDSLAKTIGNCVITCEEEEHEKNNSDMGSGLGE